MNDQAQLGVVTMILLIVFLLIGGVSASILLTEQTTFSEEDLNHMTDEIVDELCSYLQIKQIIGKYQILQGQQTIQQIAVLIKPLVTQDIDISSMTITLDNGEQLQVLFYIRYAAPIGSRALFDHPLWDNTSSGSFSILSIIDDDNSIIRSHVINKNNDMAFILIRLPGNMAIQYGDQIKMTLTPSPGVGRTVLLEPPMPMKSLVTLYE
jgi:archaellin